MPTESGTDRALLARFGAAHRAAVRAEWSAAVAAGLEMRIVDDGGLLLGAAPSIPSSMFNRGLGFTEQPGRVDVALAFFAEHGVAGEIVLDPADAPVRDRATPPSRRLRGGPGRGGCPGNP